MKGLIVLLSAVSSVTALAFRAPAVAQDLAALVSVPSSVSIELQARWSDFNAPLPSVVVNVTSEKDVAAVVCWQDPVPKTGLTSSRSSIARRQRSRSWPRMAAWDGQTHSSSEALACSSISRVSTQ